MSFDPRYIVTDRRSDANAHRQALEMPRPGSTDRDAFGGWVLPVSQKWWGHRAEKRTWVYIVGIDPGAVPAMPLVLGEAERVCGLWSGRDRATARKEIGPAEREHSPRPFATWLLDTARLAG